MRREGRQHGLVRTRLIPQSYNFRSKSKVVNQLDSRPTAGVFAKVSSKPTNHSKPTGGYTTKNKSRSPTKHRWIDVLETDYEFDSDDPHEEMDVVRGPSEKLDDEKVAIKVAETEVTEPLSLGGYLVGWDENDEKKGEWFFVGTNPMSGCSNSIVNSQDTTYTERSSDLDKLLDEFELVGMRSHLMDDGLNS